MLYMPTIEDEFMYWRSWALLFNDPVMYAWMHWEVEAAKAHLWQRPKFERIDEPAFADTVLWRARWGFDTGNRRSNSPFVVPPV